MKITMKAMLINATNEQNEVIDKMMLVFCTAIRYAFKRILEGMKINILEKEVAHKYNLNIRQSKDAVEAARQTIASQKELLKVNYDSYKNKCAAIENILKEKDLTEKKRNTLLKKLEKRQRKAAYFKKFIDNNTIPSVTFGTKQMFLKRCKGLISKKEWRDCRNNRIYSRGDKSKSGNPNLRVIMKNAMTFLEISTLEKT